MSNELNPYAPPATSEPFGEEPEHPARRLWPVYVMALLRSVGVRSYLFGSFFRLARQHGDRTLGYSSLGSQVGHGVGTLLGALLADQRFARMGVVVALSFSALAILAGTFAADNLVLLVVMAGIASCGSSVGHVVETGYVLRGVTVRGCYLSVMLLQLVYGVGGFLSSYGQALFEISSLASLAPAGLTLLAALAVAGLSRPADSMVLSAEVDDPLARKALSVKWAIGLVVLLGATAGCLSVLQKSLPELLQASSRGMFGVRDMVTMAVVPSFVVGLVVPFVAFSRRWQPRTIMSAGVLLSAAAGGAIAGGGFWRLKYVVLVGGALAAIGDNSLFDVALLPLIRQQVSIDRVALWYGGSALAQWLVPFAGSLPKGELQQVNVATVAILVLLVGLMRVTRDKRASDAQS